MSMGTEYSTLESTTERIYVHTYHGSRPQPTWMLGIMAVKADESFFSISSTLNILFDAAVEAKIAFADRSK